MEVLIENCATHGMVVKIVGRLDTISSTQFEKEIQPVMESDMKDVVIDCTELDYICSTGLRLFLMLQKESMKKNGNLKIRSMKDELKTVFNMTGFSRLFIFE